MTKNKDIKKSYDLLKIAEDFLNMELSVEQVAKGSELSIERVIEIKKKMVQ